VPYIGPSGGGGGAAPVGASVLIPQQTISGGSGQVTLGTATWDTSGFLAGNELDFPAGLSGVYAWGAELYVTQPALVGAYMDFQVRTNGAPVNLQATLPLTGTGITTGAVYTTLWTETEPAGIAFDGTVHAIKVFVPASWRLKLTTVNATLGLTTYY